MITDDSLNIYALANGSSYKFVYTLGNYKVIEISNNLKPDRVFIKILKVKGRYLYIAYCLKNEEFIFHHLNKPVYIQLYDNKRILKLKHTRMIAAFRNFIKTNNDFNFNYSKNLGTLLNGEKPFYIPISSIVLYYTRDKNGHTCVGYLNAGLFALDENDSIINHYLQKLSVNNVIIDFQNVLWITTAVYGIYRFEYLKDNQYSQTDPLSAPISFIQKIENKLFIGTNNGNVYELESGVFNQIRKADNNLLLGSPKTHKNDTIRFNYSLETMVLNKSKLKSIHSKSIKNYDIISLHPDPLNFIWRRGIRHCDKGIFVKKIDFEQKIMLSELIDPTMCLGTESGVYPFKPIFNTLSVSMNAALIPNKEKLKHYSITIGLPSAFINHISFINETFALLSTNKDLFCSYYSFNALATSKCRYIYPREVKNAVVFAAKIYLDSKNDLVFLNNDKLKTDADNLFFNLSLITRDESEPNKESFKVYYSFRNTLEFYFDIITFQNSKPDIKYILQGPSSDTDYVSNPLIKLTRLSPGNYSREAFPNIKKGIQLKICIPFKVNPGFMQTTLFKTLFYFFGIAFWAVIFWLWNRNKRKTESQKIKNEQLLIEYKLIALNAQINPHFISNCLSAIQNLIKGNQKDEAAQYIAKFGLLARKILDYSSKQVIRLEEELDLLIHYLDLEQLRFTENFTYHIQVEDTVNKREIYIPPLILNPIVENAIWHGLLPIVETKEGILFISIKIVQNSLEIKIEDNGVGRNSKLKSASNYNSTSFGLKVTEQRLNNINFLYSTKEARFIFTDLTEDNKPSGTRVTIYLPLQLNPKKHEQNQSSNYRR